MNAHTPTKEKYAKVKRKGAAMLHAIKGVIRSNKSPRPKEASLEKEHVDKAVDPFTAVSMHPRWLMKSTSPHVVEKGEKEIKLYKVVTDFDKVLSLVQEKGFVSEAEVRKKLGLSLQQFELTCAVLQKSGKIKIEYPLFGGAKLIDVMYKKKSTKSTADEVIKISDEELDAESKKIEDKKRIE